MPDAVYGVHLATLALDREQPAADLHMLAHFARQCRGVHDGRKLWLRIRGLGCSEKLWAFGMFGHDVGLLRFKLQSFGFVGCIGETHRFGQAGIRGLDLQDEAARLCGKACRAAGWICAESLCFDRPFLFQAVYERQEKAAEKAAKAAAEAAKKAAKKKAKKAEVVSSASTDDASKARQRVGQRVKEGRTQCTFSQLQECVEGLNEV